MEANNDVWMGWSWWAGGPKWGNYMFTLDPTNIGQPSQTDRSAMAVLQPHLAPIAPAQPGDFNNNGVFDAADYVVWRKNPGAFPQTDYDTWRSKFGASLALTATGSSIPCVIPEPGSLALLSLGVMWFGSTRRRGAQLH